MSRSLRTAGLSLAAVLAASTVDVAPAAAEWQVGGGIGGRFFSDNQLLGFNPDASTHRTLSNGLVFTGRIGMTIGKYLVPEIELPLSPASVQGTGTSVFWIGPRAHLRINLLPGKRFNPFVALGGGGVVGLSSDSDIFKTSIQGEGYLGVGGLLQIRPKVLVRFDIKASVGAGLDPKATMEGEFGIGVLIPIGGAAAPAKAKVVSDGTVDDPDGDKVIGSADQCPDRPEDADSFEDEDGCPDIDNDGDRVLDDIDKCGVPEAVNGFEDYDGCPDTVPAELEAKMGVIAGLTFAAGKAELPAKADAALQPVADLVTKWPSIKLVIIGHAGPDDAIAGEDDDDGSAAAQATSMARAEAVQARLYELGVSAGSLVLEAKGNSEPVSGKAPAQRRVEIKLFVPNR